MDLPPSHWPTRKITNSAVSTMLSPISVTTCPDCRTSVGLVSSSHLMKKASSPSLPKSAPSSHCLLRKPVPERETGLKVIGMDVYSWNPETGKVLEKAQARPF